MKNLVNKKYIATLIGIFVSIIIFQNCSEKALYLMSDKPSSLEISSQSEVVSSLPSKQSLLVHNKTYIAGLFRDIFARNANDIDLETLINRWINFRPAQFGGACNIYNTYSQADCGGDVTNANLTLHIDAGTLREVYRLKLCTQVLNTDAFIDAALDKIGKAGTAPDGQSPALVYSLFYRDQEPAAAVITALTELDKALVLNTESAVNRWRALFLIVCETTGWQLQ